MRVFARSPRPFETEGFHNPLLAGKDTPACWRDQTHWSTSLATRSGKLPTLNRWHQRDCIPWFKRVFALDPLGSRRDQKMLVPRLQAWSFLIQLGEKILDGRSFR
jgi:hypothetical protein